MKAGSANDQPGVKAAIRLWGIGAVVVALVALLQCFSLVHFSDQNVDESEVVAYAVGFLGGDLNPHWFGYGSFPLYLLGLFYLAAWCVGHLLGFVGSIDQYAQLLITNEHFFYGTARYLFACVGVATVFLYARTLWRIGVPSVLAFAYFALAVTHPHAVGYANFVKTDQFVGLFFAIAVFGLVGMRSGKSHLMAIAAVAALALTSKISAAPILALLAIAGYLDFARHRSWRRLVVAALLFLLVVIVTQPYSSPIAVAIKQLKAHASDRIASVVRPIYDNPWDRLAAISTFMLRYLSRLHIAVLALLPFALVREARRATLGFLFVLLLVISPFLIASDIQPYWMIPVYPLLGLFPVLGAFGAFALARRHSIGGAQVVLSLMLLLALFIVLRNVGPIVSHWREPAEMTNRRALQTWLERNVLGTDIVVLERSYSNLMPQVNDLSSLATSREASRLFVFNRKQNEFLGGIFDSYLVHDYRDRVAAVPRLVARKASSLSLQLDLSAKGPLAIETPRICDGTDRCATMQVQSVRGGTLEANEGGYTLRPSKHRQRLFFKADGKLSFDGSQHLELAARGKSERAPVVAIGPDGEFYPGERLSLPASGHLRVPLIQLGQRPWLINYRSPADLQIPVAVGRRMLFVTSPAIYDRYLALDRTRFTGKELALVAERQDFYSNLLSQAPPLLRVSSGRGAVMEVYDVTGLRGAALAAAGPARKSDPDAPLWLEPSAIEVCRKATTVLVHWDARRVPGVTKVEVKTVRPRGQEGLFARGGVVGAKRTGSWMSAGRQLILRNGKSGAEIGRVTLGGLPCGQPTPTQ